MKTAKERYYELKKQTDKYFEGFRDPIHDYVTELEQELTKLKESQTQKSIIKLCNRMDKAEADKAELLEFVRDIAYNDISRNDITLDWVQKASWELLNKHTDKSTCPMK